MGSAVMKVAAAAAVALALGLAVLTGYVAGRDDAEPRVVFDAAPSQATPPAEDVSAGSGTAQDGGRSQAGPSWRTNEVRIGRQQAEASALGRFPDGRVLHAELEEEDGFFLWEVFVQRSDGSFVDVFIDADDGSVLGIDHEGFDD